MHDPPLTVAQYLALRAVGGAPTTGAELAQRSGVSDAAVSQLVAGLADAGWVERRPDPADRRRSGLVLSAAGTGVLRSATALLRRRLEPVLEGLPPPERHAIARLEEILTGTAPPRRPPPPPRPGRRP